MTVKGQGCSVTVEVDAQAAAVKFLSNDMRDLVAQKAEEYVKEKDKGAKQHLHGEMPTSGLFGYRMKRGRKTWMAVIHPNNRAAYAIGRKYGTKNL